MKLIPQHYIMPNKNNLDHLRDKIDQIDSQIIKLLKLRQKIGLSIAKLKKDHNIKIFQRKRELDALQKRIDLAKKNSLDKSFISKLFKLIFTNSRKQQRCFDNADKNL